jgi:Na+/H+ antiporter NhaC
LDIAEDLLTINAGLWAFAPTIAAIIAVFILRDVIASLLIGVVTGAVIYAIMLKAGMLTFLNLFFASIFDSAIENIPLITFMIILGAIVSVITLSGGHYAYGRWIEKKIKTLRGVSLATIALGVLIFIDDYFSILLTGAVMGPIADKYKMSREKLAYFIDSTAAPVCILAPISSWTIPIALTVENAGIEGGLFAFIRSIPYNFYAIFALIFALYIAVSHKDFFYMRQYEAQGEVNRKKDEIYDAKIDETGISGKGRVIDLLLPNITVIVLVLLSIIWLGGFFGPEKVSLLDAFAEADMTLAINFGCFGALLVCFLLYIPRRLLSVRRFFEGAVEGMKSMFTAILILVLAWTLSTITTTYLGAGTNIELLMNNMQNSVNLSFLPVAIFLISAGVSFGLGSWGTFLITIPFIAIIANATDPAMFYLFLGATLGGAVFGDHASPITDTTILSSLSARCDHIGHVKTQLPYALVVLSGSAGAFMVIGLLWRFGESASPFLILSYGIGLAFITGLLLLIYRAEKRKT